MTTRNPPSPLAQDMPVSEAVALAASTWLAEIMSGEMDTQGEQRWMAWRAEHPDHERAWKHIEAVLGRIGMLDKRAAARSLAALEHKTSSRRSVLRAMAGIGITAGVGYSVYTASGGPSWTADFRTGIGEQRSITLEDGTRITLNTNSAIDVHFDEAQRRVRLIAGEMMVVTGHALLRGTPDSRPFLVQTREGQVVALGTQFLVRQYDGDTGVGVLESAVDITPDASLAGRLILQAGQQTRFTRTKIQRPEPLSPEAAAWTKGQLVAENQTLQSFLVELNRFRRGWIYCDPNVAALRFSGVFPVTDPEQILALLPNTLPIRIRRYSPYLVWVSAS